MIARHTTLRLLASAVASVVIGSSVLSPSIATAAPAAAAVAADGSQPFVGLLNDDNVYVRSGPSDVYYATTKLTKGAKVTAVATRSDWLKILPPEGSYSYVAKAYVEKRGDGTVGRVTKADLNVRAGSILNGLKTTVQTSLEQGEDVKIVGEQDEYFKIAPPAGAYLYIKKSFVDPAPQEVPAVPPVPVEKVRDPIASNPVPANNTPANNVVVAPPAGGAPVPAGNVIPPDAQPTTKPSEVAAVPAPSTQPVAVAPATQPAELTAEAKFDAAEAAFLDASSLPLNQQPVASLLKKYTALSADSTLPLSMKKITDMRVSTLKLRSDAREQYTSALKLASEAKARQVSLRAEQDELSQRIKDQQVMMFAALGTLRTSSLQQSGTTMYRLTDPGTGRTLVYVRSNDSKYAGMLNQFIGVKGDVTEDTNLSLKMITPTDAEQVDQAKVNTTVSAGIIPPSLLPKAATASLPTGN